MGLCIYYKIESGMAIWFADNFQQFMCIIDSLYTFNATSFVTLSSIFTSKSVQKLLVIA
jgi:hypothetical protein